MWRVKFDKKTLNLAQLYNLQKKREWLVLAGTFILCPIILVIIISVFFKISALERFTADVFCSERPQRMCVSRATDHSSKTGNTALHLRVCMIFTLSDSQKRFPNELYCWTFYVDDIIFYRNINIKWILCFFFPEVHVYTSYKWVRMCRFSYKRKKSNIFSDLLRAVFLD